MTDKIVLVDGAVTDREFIQVIHEDDCCTVFIDSTGVIHVESKKGLRARVSIDAHGEDLSLEAENGTLIPHFSGGGAPYCVVTATEKW